MYILVLCVCMHIVYDSSTRKTTIDAIFEKNETIRNGQMSDSIGVHQSYQRSRSVCVYHSIAHAYGRIHLVYIYGADRERDMYAFIH